jgi:hypothetical protein
MYIDNFHKKLIISCNKGAKMKYMHRYGVAPSKLITFVIVVVLISQSFSFSASATHSSSYFITKSSLPNIGLGGFVPISMIKKGNLMYGATTYNGRGIVVKMENGNTTVIAGSYATWEPQEFSQITSIDVADDGRIFVAEPDNHVVKVVYPDGNVDVVAGNGQISDSRTDADDATQTAFNWPTYVKIGPNGLLYIMDQGIVRRVEADGSTTHILGKFGATAQSDPYVESGIAVDNYFPTGTPASGGIPNNVHYMDFDSEGRLFVTTFMSIYMLELDGTIHEYFQPAYAPYTPEDIPMADKALYSTYSLLSGFGIAPDDSVWLAVSNATPVYDDDGGFKYTMSAIVRFHEGIAYTVAGGGTINIDSSTPGYGHDLVLSGVYGLTIDSIGNAYFANAGNIFNPYQTQVGNYVGRLSLNTDTTPPDVTHSFSSEPNINGWNNSPTTLSWSISDHESTVMFQEGCETNFINYETDQVFKCAVTSNGGTTIESVTVKYDSTAPNIIGTSWTQNPIAINQSSKVAVSASDIISNVERVEYFVGDIDPGQGNGIEMNIEGLNFTSTIGSSFSGNRLCWKLE